MSLDKLAVALTFWARLMGLETPAIEEVRFSIADASQRTACAKATFRRITQTQQLRLIVQVDPTSCGAYTETYVARHELCHFRLQHHLDIGERNPKNGRLEPHGREFDRCMRDYAQRADRRELRRQAWARRSR